MSNSRCECESPSVCSCSSSDSCSTEEYCPPRSNYKKDGGITFAAMICPAVNVHGVHSNHGNCVEFTIRRLNKVATFQWEPFTGITVATGNRYLVVAQAINNLPRYRLVYPISMIHRGREVIGSCIVDPCFTHGNGNIAFLLPPDVTASDSFEIHGSCISWVIN